MTQVTQSWIARFSVLLLISGSTFAVYVVVASMMGWWVSDGAVIYDLALLPKRLVLDQFLTGLQQSLVVTVPLGILAVADYSTLARFKGTLILSGLSLPIALLAVGYWWYQGDNIAMMTLAVVGLILWILYRIFLLICSRKAT